MVTRQGHSVEMVLPGQTLSIDEEPSPQIQVRHYRLAVKPTRAPPKFIPFQTFPAYNVKDPPNAWKHLVLLATSMVLVFSTWFSATAALPQLKDRWDLSQNQASFLTIGMTGFELRRCSSDFGIKTESLTKQRFSLAMLSQHYRLLALEYLTP
jgi:hypothetical protein